MARPKPSPGYNWARRHALNTQAAAIAWQFQDRLEASQWLDGDGIRAQQLRTAQPLLQHAIANVPWYGRTLAGLDLRAAPTPDVWRTLPILTRADVQGHADDLKARTYPESHGKTGEIGSSGSTGRPVIVMGTDLTQNWHRALTLRTQLWWTSRFDRTLAVIRRYKRGLADYPAGGTTPRWADDLTLPMATGAAATLGIHALIHEQVEWLQRVDPDLLVTYPSNLLALSDHCERHRIRLAKLKGVMTLGELLLPDSRAAARRVFNAEIFDVYSANETGYIAVQCPSSDAYHVQAEAMMVEVVDEAGLPCPLGQTGRVLITLLYNYAMPLIRYEIGDLAVAGRTCGCGRGLPVLTKVVGRQRNMLVLADGSRVTPSFGARELRTIAPIEQFQFVQHSPAHLEVRVVTPEVLTDDQQVRIRQAVLSRLPLPMLVTVTRVAEIPRGPGGKYEMLISMVERR